MHDHAGELVLRDGGIDIHALALGEQTAGVNLFLLFCLRRFLGHGDIGDLLEDHGTLACGDRGGFLDAEGSFDQRLGKARARDGEKGDYREQRDGNGDGRDEASKAPVLFLLDCRRCIGSGIHALCGVSAGGIGNVHGSCAGGVVHVHGCSVGGVLHIGGRTIGCGLGIRGRTVNGNGSGRGGVPVCGGADGGLGACTGVLAGIGRTRARGVLPGRIDRRDVQPVRTRAGGSWRGPVLGALLLGCVCTWVGRVLLPGPNARVIHGSAGVLRRRGFGKAGAFLGNPFPRSRFLSAVFRSGCIYFGDAGKAGPFGSGCLSIFGGNGRRGLLLPDGCFCGGGIICGGFLC